MVYTWSQQPSWWQKSNAPKFCYCSHMHINDLAKQCNKTRSSQKWQVNSSFKNPSTATPILTNHRHNAIFEETLTYFLQNHASLLHLRPSIPGSLQLLQGEPWPFPCSCRKSSMIILHVMHFNAYSSIAYNITYGDCTCGIWREATGLNWFVFWA